MWCLYVFATVSLTRKNININLLQIFPLSLVLKFINIENFIDYDRA